MAAATTSVKSIAFRDLAQGLATQIVDQLAGEFENELSQWSAETDRLRSELSKAADLMRICIGREKQLHEILEELTGQQALNVNTGHEAPVKTGVVIPRALSVEQSVSAPIVYSAPPVSTVQQPMSSRHGYGVSPKYYAQAKQLLESVAELENEINKISFMLDTSCFNASIGVHRASPACIMAAPPAQQSFPHRTHAAHVRSSRSVSKTPAGRPLHVSTPSTPYPEVTYCATTPGPRIALQPRGIVSPGHPAPLLEPVAQQGGCIVQTPPIVRCACPTTAMPMMSH